MESLRRAAARVALLLTAALAATAAAEPQPGSPGAALYEARCASCHSQPSTTKAPSLAAMRQMSGAQVFFSMTSGKMRSESAGLSFPELGALAAHVSSLSEPYVPAASALCEKRGIELGAVLVAQRGFDSQNSGAQSARITSVDARNVASLRLRWAFGLPNSAEARSQPVITQDTLFVAATGSGLFALDRSTGCIKWYVPQATPIRTALTLGSVTRDAEPRATLFFGDAAAYVSAVDAESGELVWRRHVGLFDSSILTGAPIQHGTRLLVPISLYEVVLARDPSYACCKAHGAVRALSADTGEILWTRELTPEATPRAKTAAGVPLWGPSGVPVWSTPTVDAARSRVYVATGQNGSSPATELSDSVIALDLETGARVWHFQALANDAYNDACSTQPKGPNCPVEDGPDYDFGASVVLAKDSSGRDVLIAAQKSGHVYALDPDASGKLRWQRRVGAGSVLGGVHWGVAVADGRIFVPIADDLPAREGMEPKPGLYALAIDDGAVLWSHPIVRGCDTDVMAYFMRDSLYPECSFYFGLSAAPTALPGLVFAPGLDGRVRAFSARDGALLWEHMTAAPYETVNGVSAHGGSIDNVGVQAAGAMVYVQSGYSLFGLLPGNVLLAFSLEGEAPTDAASPAKP